MAVTPELLNVSAAVQALARAYQAAAPLRDASTAARLPVIYAAQQAAAAIDTAITVTDALVDTSGVFGIAATVFAPTLAAHLLAQLATANNEVTLMIEKGAVGRILVNLNQAPG